MSRLLLPAVWLVLLASTARADDPPPAPPAPPADPLADVLAKLRKPARLQNASALTLDAYLAQLGQEIGVQFVINSGAFPPDVKAGETKLRQPELPTGVRTEQALRLVLNAIECRHLIRRGYVEIVSATAVGPYYDPQTDDPHRQEAVPLASAVIKKQPLANALADLAGAYEQTVILSPKAEEAAKTPVSARLQNVPFDTAVELLTEQAELMVVRKGRTFVVATTGALATLTPPGSSAFKARMVSGER